MSKAAEFYESENVEEKYGFNAPRKTPRNEISKS